MGSLKAAILAALKPGEIVTAAQMCERLAQYPRDIVVSGVGTYLTNVGNRRNARYML